VGNKSFFDVRVYARTLQVVKLKEQLSEAEKEIQRLSQQRAEPVRSNSTRSSSPSEETTMGAQAAFIGEFEMDEYGDVFNTPAFYYAQGIDWINQYI
jgi:homeobox-leucine zipper protein